jgi:predicted nucleic acid-binding protein
VLYWDSSALIKHYVQEAGTESIENKLRVEENASRPAFTSVLTFAEIHAALARRMKDKSLSYRKFVRSRKKFDADWAFGLSIIDLEPAVLGNVRDIVLLGLTSADAVHLASAIWLRDTTTLGPAHDAENASVIFLTADEKLAQAAVKRRFAVFNPLIDA